MSRLIISSRLHPDKLLETNYKGLLIYQGLIQIILSLLKIIKKKSQALPERWPEKISVIKFSSQRFKRKSLKICQLLLQIQAYTCLYLLITSRLFSTVFQQIWVKFVWDYSNFKKWQMFKHFFILFFLHNQKMRDFTTLCCYLRLLQTYYNFMHFKMHLLMMFLFKNKWKPH